MNKPFKVMRRIGFYLNEEASLQVVHYLFPLFFHGLRNWMERTKQEVLTVERGCTFWISLFSFDEPSLTYLSLVTIVRNITFSWIDVCTSIWCKSDHLILHECWVTQPVGKKERENKKTKNKLVTTLQPLIKSLDLCCIAT